jgi:hypothetical protein
MALPVFPINAVITNTQTVADNLQAAIKIALVNVLLLAPDGPISQAVAAGTLPADEKDKAITDATPPIATTATGIADGIHVGLLGLLKQMSDRIQVLENNNTSMQIELNSMNWGLTGDLDPLSGVALYAAAQASVESADANNTAIADIQAELQTLQSELGLGGS